MHIKTLLIILAFCTANSASAFSHYAHQLICDIAYNLVSTEGKNFIDRVMSVQNVAGNFTSFGKACTWADAVRTTSHRETYEYHYINVPKGQELNPARDCAAFDCVTQAVQRYAIYLSTATTRPEDRKEALLFLGHFVGDLHQPLHVGNTEDRGGNTINITISSHSRTTKTNLHAVWDHTMGIKAGLHRRNAKDLLLTAIRHADTQTWKKPQINLWAVESFKLAREIAYQHTDGTEITDNSRLTDDDYDRGKLIVKQQVMKAAVRLAMLIDMAANSEIKPDSLIK